MYIDPDNIIVRNKHYMFSMGNIYHIYRVYLEPYYNLPIFLSVNDFLNEQLSLALEFTTEETISLDNVLKTDVIKQFKTEVYNYATSVLNYIKSILGEEQILTGYVECPYIYVESIYYEIIEGEEDGYADKLE